MPAEELIDPTDIATQRYIAEIMGGKCKSNTYLFALKCVSGEVQDFAICRDDKKSQYQGLVREYSKGTGTFYAGEVEGDTTGIQLKLPADPSGGGNRAPTESIKIKNHVNGKFNRSFTTVDYVFEVLRDPSLEDGKAVDSGDEATRYNARIERMKPEITRAIKLERTLRMDSRIRPRVARLDDLKRAGDFTAAHNLLNQIETLMNQVEDIMNQTKARFKLRYNNQKDNIIAAIKARSPASQDLKSLFSEMKSLAREQRVIEAIEFMDRIEALMGSMGSPEVVETSEEATENTEEMGRGISQESATFLAIQRARYVWDEIRIEARSTLQTLENEILAIYKDRPNFAEVKDRVQTLYEILTPLDDDSLTGILNSALDASGDELQQLCSKAKTTMQTYQRAVDGDELLASLATNPFKPVSLKADLQRTLESIASYLN